MIFVVVLEPSGDLAERVRQGIDANIVAFEGFDEALRYAIRFRTLNRREARYEIERYREVARLLIRA